MNVKHLPSAGVHHLVGMTEIAEMLGVTRQRVHQLIQEPDFPRPDAELSAGRIWKRSAIERWAKSTGRTIQGEETP